jgi:hypothetical protein
VDRSPCRAYALHLGLAGSNRDHDREAFRSFSAYLLLWTMFLFKHGCFPLKEVI